MKTSNEHRNFTNRLWEKYCHFCLVTWICHFISPPLVNNLPQLNASLYEKKTCTNIMGVGGCECVCACVSM